MAIIAISRQVAALGDEISKALSEKLGYRFVNRKELEKRIMASTISPVKTSKTPKELLNISS